MLDTLRAWDRAVTRRGEQRRLLVDGRTPVNYEMVAPVLRLLSLDPRVEVGLTASEEPDRLHAIYPTAPAGSWLVGPRRAAVIRWDAYLTSDFMWATLPRGTRRIQMFHGVGGKYGFDAPSESMRQWDRLFFVNERRLRNFITAGALDRDARSARLIGMPKVDCLVDGSLRRADALDELRLDPSRLTVLYAPTWSPASSLNVMGLALVERLRALPVNLVVKLHDRSKDPRARYSGGVDWVAQLTPLLQPPYGALAGGANIAPYLTAADVLITDHSSAGFEYLLLDRPLVRIHLPELIRDAQVHADYVSLMASAADNVEDVASTVAAVERALADGRARSAERRRVAADLFYRPGTATARCAAALYEVLDLQPPAWLGSRAEESLPCLQSA